MDRISEYRGAWALGRTGRWAVMALLVSAVAFSAWAQAPVKIMCLGDSITQGNVDHDSFRRPLWHMLDDAGFNIDFVGSLDTNFGGPNPHPDFDLDHEGHWGWPAEQILANINTFLAANVPDIVLIHLGSNDIRLNESNASTIDELGQIIDALRGANPNVTVLLAQITPGEHVSNPNFNTDVTALNALIPGLAASKTTAQSPVIVVDQNTGFDYSTDTYDGLHPNAVGELKMADRWYAALATVLDPLHAPPGTPLAWWPLAVVMVVIAAALVWRRTNRVHT